MYYKKKFRGNIKHNFHIHGYNTRGIIELQTQSYNTALYQKGAVNMCVKLHNRLPDRIKTLNDIKSFKKEVRFLFLNNSFYTIKEFLQFY